jgi:peptidoglycan hydrolase CwlO-like protein
MTKKHLLFWLFLLLLIPCFMFGSRISAQTEDPFAQQLSEISAQRTALQKQLADIETQINQFQKDLTKIGAQKKTLANKVKQLKIKQAQLLLQIKEMTLRLEDSRVQILQNQADAQVNSGKISLLKDQTAEIIRQMWKLDRYSSLDILVSSENISNFYDRLHSFEIIGDGLGQLLQSLKVAEKNLQNTEKQLAAKQEEEANYVQIVSLQKDQLTLNLQDQNTLLTQTKGKEENYQSMLKQSKEEAAAIRNRIYSLIEVSEQITFGQAVSVATWAGGQTGVRPAMLLAILTQESNLGKNVGTCNRAGDPANKSYKVIMKPERDIQPFLQITKELGRNPDVTPVSCPMKGKNGKQVGWGGAMGPAQFIPSTWMGYRAKITAITGGPADPWDIRDAFLAASIKLAADGATSKSGEWTAAMKYFSGSTNVAYRFYGDNVVATAAKYQEDIDKLGN